MSKLDELIAFHSKHCAKIGYGKCTLASCIKRGGHKHGTRVDYDKATCEPLETVELLRNIKRAVAP